MAANYEYEHLSMLNQVAKHLARGSNLEKDLRLVLDWLADMFDMNRGVITLINEAGNEVQADITGSAVPLSTTDKMRYGPGEGITGEVFAGGKSVFVPQMDRGKFLDRSGLRQNMDQANFSFFCVPISYMGTVVGTLSVDKERERVSDPDLELRFLEEVAQLMAPYVQRRRLEDRFELFQHARQPGGAFSKLVGKSTALLEVQKLLVKVADANTTVIITGETGTGKGVAAQLIHELGPRKQQPFVEVNCGAIPENLIESELFGHEKGAFTGAVQKRIGVMERAKSGTVFLDEIGELPLTAQTRLLRVLQTKDFERVGGTKTMRCTARIIAATNRDLEQAVAEGSFRSDLYYRLNVFPIQLPPVRERGKADIMLLVDYFVQRFAAEQEKEIHRIDTPAIDMLTAYHWPGNVRELENVIERAVLLSDKDVIHGHHLPPSLQMNKYSVSCEDMGDFQTRVKNFEIELITEALKDTNGNQTQAAIKLGLTKRIIQYKIKNYNIDYRRFR